jgi:hypothetical protein
MNGITSAAVQSFRIESRNGENQSASVSDEPWVSESLTKLSAKSVWPLKSFLLPSGLIR